MRRRINVRPTLANVSVNLREESSAHCIWPFIVPVNYLSRFIWKTGPARNAWLKRMRKIDKIFGGESFLDLPKGVLILASCNHLGERQRNPSVQELLVTMHALSLDHGSARIQQVR